MTRVSPSGNAEPAPTVETVLRFEDLPVGETGSRRAVVRWSDGTEGEGLRWYGDEVLVCEGDLVGKTEAGRGKVYVVRDQHAHLTSVRLGTDNGLRVSVLGGLKGEDEVIVHPGSAVSEGATVSGTLWNEAPAKTTSD